MPLSTMARKPPPSPLHAPTIPSATNFLTPSPFSLNLPAYTPTSWPPMPSAAPAASEWTAMSNPFDMFKSSTAEAPADAASIFPADTILASTFDGLKGDRGVKVSRVTQRTAGQIYIASPWSCAGSVTGTFKVDEFEPMAPSINWRDSFRLGYESIIGAYFGWAPENLDITEENEEFLQNSKVITEEPVLGSDDTSESSNDNVESTYHLPFRLLDTPTFIDTATFYNSRPVSKPKDPAYSKKSPFGAIGSPLPSSGSSNYRTPCSANSIWSVFSIDNKDKDDDLTSMDPILTPRSPPHFTNPFAHRSPSAARFPVHIPVSLSPRQVESPTLPQPGVPFYRRRHIARPGAIFAPSITGCLNEGFLSPEEAEIAIKNFQPTRSRSRKRSRNEYVMEEEKEGENKKVKPSDKKSSAMELKRIWGSFSIQPVAQRRKK